jgi:hypothetical protein
MTGLLFTTTFIVPGKVDALEKQNEETMVSL